MDPFFLLHLLPGCLLKNLAGTWGMEGAGRSEGARGEEERSAAISGAPAGARGPRGRARGARGRAREEEERSVAISGAPAGARGDEVTSEGLLLARASSGAPEGVATAAGCEVEVVGSSMVGEGRTKVGEGSRKVNADFTFVTEIL